MRKLLLMILGMPKTILMNFYYFPFEVAIKLPILVSHRMSMGGTIELREPKSGLVQIGLVRLVFLNSRSLELFYKLKGIWFLKLRLG